MTISIQLIGNNNFNDFSFKRIVYKINGFYDIGDLFGVDD